MLPTALLQPTVWKVLAPKALSTEEWLENALAQWLDMGRSLPGILIAMLVKNRLN